jgi:hypothetical protein
VSERLADAAIELYEREGKIRRLNSLMRAHDLRRKTGSQNPNHSEDSG